MPARISFAQIALWLSTSDRVAMAVVVGVVGGLAPPGQRVAALPLGLAAGLCLAVALIDLRHRKIPDLLNLALAALGLVDAALTQGLAVRLLTMAGLWVALEVLRLAYARLRGHDGMGGGDVKFIIAAAAWLPWSLLPTWLLAAALSGIVQALARRDRGIPFGAHLAPWLILFALIRP